MQYKSSLIKKDTGYTDTLSCAKNHKQHMGVISACVLASLLSLSACTTSKPDSYTLARQEARSVLMEAANEVKQSAHELAAVKRAEKGYVRPMWVDTPSLDTPVDVTWNGDVVALLEHVLPESGYSLEEVGTRPKNKVMVSVDAKQQRLGALLSDLDAQIHPQARLHVNTRYKLIEVRYDS